MSFDPLTQKLSKNDTLRLQSGTLIIDNRRGLKLFLGRVFHRKEYSQTAILSAFQSIYNNTKPVQLNEIKTFKHNYDKARKRFSEKNDNFKNANCLKKISIVVFFGKTSSIKDKAFYKNINKALQGEIAKEFDLRIGTKGISKEDFNDFLKTENLNDNKNDLQTYIKYFKFYKKAPKLVNSQFKLVNNNLSEALNFYLAKISNEPLDELITVKTQLDRLKKVLEQMNADPKIVPILKQLSAVLAALEIKEETTNFSKEFKECIEGCDGAYADPDATIFDALSALGELGIDKLENFIAIVNTYTVSGEPLALPKHAVDYTEVLDAVGLLKIADYQKKKIFSKEAFCNHIAENVDNLRKKLQKFLKD